jgi:hypothetical protein
MSVRVVRFAPFFFDRLDDYFGEGRTEDGAPSSTDFLLYDLAIVRDKLAQDYEGCTLPVLPGGATRVYVGIGLLVGGFALYLLLAEDGCVEVIDLEL